MNKASAQSFQRYPSTSYPGYQSIQSFANSSDAFATGASQQPDQVPRDVNEYRSMSPSNWENPRPGQLPLTNPFKSERSLTQSPPSQPKGGEFWPSQMTSESNPWGRQSVVDRPSANSILEPKSNTNARFMGSVNASPGNPAMQQTSQRYPLAQDQDLYGTPPVPSDIRIDLDFPNSQDTPVDLELPAVDRRSADFVPSEQGVGNSEFYSDSLSKSLLGVGSRDSGPQNPGQSFPPPNPHYRPTEPTFQSPFFAHPQPVVSPSATSGFSSDVGHRALYPTVRDFNDNDYGQLFDFEEKRTEYPSLSEIFATGRYFGSASVKYLRPSFSGNTAIFREVAGVAETFSFGYSTAPQFQIGFESRFGPGIELTYFNLRDTSRASTFISDGIERGTTSVWMPGANRFSQLTASNLQETLTARHRIALDSLGVCFFKDFTFRRIRVDGRFGFQSVRVTHELNAQVVDAGGFEAGSLRGRSDIRAFGPQFGLDYYRPIGHTKLEFLVGMGGSVLFGKQNQFIENSTDTNLRRTGARETIVTVNFFSGVQYRQMLAENRYLFARGGVFNQVWLGGGTAVVPQDDFGLRGFQLTIGYNR